MWSVIQRSKPFLAVIRRISKWVAVLTYSQFRCLCTTSTWQWRDFLESHSSVWINRAPVCRAGWTTICEVVLAGQGPFLGSVQTREAEKLNKSNVSLECEPSSSLLCCFLSLSHFLFLVWFLFPEDRYNHFFPSAVIQHMEIFSALLRGWPLQASCPL